MTAVATGRSRPIRMRPWVPLLGLVTVAFLAFTLPPYLGLDPDQSRFPIRDDIWWHYPAMVTHIFFGSVALFASCLQISAWVRARHPAVHRWSGRVYVLGGIPLLGVPALLLGPLSHTGFNTQVSNTLWAILWLATTITGYRMVRQRRYAEHREWMIRSFALIWGIVLNRLWVVPLLLILSPQLETTYGGDEQAMIEDIAPASSWLSWVVSLLIAEWWLQRGRSRRQARARQQPTRQLVDSA